MQVTVIGLGPGLNTGELVTAEETTVVMHTDVIGPQSSGPQGEVGHIE